ncbi:MAG: apolipoprotein N-acyltransferase [bacterium]
MQDTVSTSSRVSQGGRARLSAVAATVRSATPSLRACSVAIVSAALLIVSFPDFDLWPLAWLALVPLFILVTRSPQPGRAFIMGWVFGTVFFYGSCYWLTYSMINFGRISPWLAFVLLIPGALLLGLFPALFAALLARAITKWGVAALFLASPFWSASEWARLETTGQLWNAVGYSQAYHPLLIQSAGWGGVYAVGFLIVSINAAMTFALLQRSVRALVITGTAFLLLAGLVLAINNLSPSGQLKVGDEADAVVVAVQPNVPMDLVKSNEDIRKLTIRHFEMSESTLRGLAQDRTPRLVIWPESPMNFAYGGDSELRSLLANFAKANNTSVLLNSQEVAPNDGIYNSAVLINQEGRLVAQYDKIRLLPFGEYVPLPEWVPGAGLVRGIVGDFTPGTKYGLMPVGDVRAGVFICIESAFPSIARRLTGAGADVLINISNDGYLGPTAVMRQHLANAIFRAVENGRPVVRVTNTGITALITSSGEVNDATHGFRPEVRTWKIARAKNAPTFYSVHGDLFAAGCSIFGLLAFLLSFRKGREGRSSRFPAR